MPKKNKAPLYLDQKSCRLQFCQILNPEKDKKNCSILKHNLWEKFSFFLIRANLRYLSGLNIMKSSSSNFREKNCIAKTNIKRDKYNTKIYLKIHIFSSFKLPKNQDFSEISLSLNVDTSWLWCLHKLIKKIKIQEPKNLPVHLNRLDDISDN